MKQRLDEYIYKNNLTESRSKAKEHIVNKKDVYVNNINITKPSFLVDISDVVEIRSTKLEHVSRAYEKLEKAINKWKIDLTNKVCLDIGASTGGFTQCCLENNARLVYAVDVGTNQLHSLLLNNLKVINMSQYNFRNAKKQDFLENIDFVCCDVSFISVEKILIPLKDIVELNTTGVFLIKPQFESQPNQIKNGRINSKLDHKQAILKVISYANSNNFDVINLDYSPILGNKKQNIEYLAYIIKKENNYKIWNEDQIDKLVNIAWKELKK
ncbi:TlyA family RNA methyltransferase [Mycoplasma feriruminatoris]|uniref:TlyA family RNA methyltransferase n=1 Tax=Mycoplasma feriruminatoris TaxID=1179777 RepID=A0ABY8HWM3_9MOLU|nr:TlyA family RNA methyltransferase [Mycoplasma feriruminatoris]WFQ90689.1 TlyA family RNA methyltransferase [Mycoplasma feriruminatoris]WFQ91510.1 Hemolysin A [Mycoplasma feriruminatoris]WFQ93205.1 TlyA family RNA methyltransferase [Mycoplasma feriruminatoris]